jgi:hypothetical protein
MKDLMPEPWMAVRILVEVSWEVQSGVPQSTKQTYDRRKPQVLPWSGEEFGEGRLEGLVGSLRERAVRLPEDAPLGIAKQDVGIVGRGKVDKLFPSVFVIEDG